jgi:hypothetical protein
MPTVLDRFIQQALLGVLQPLFDPTFSDASYGFRPGRSAHDAVPLPGMISGGAGARPDQCSEASCHSNGWKSRQQRSPDTVVVISSDGEGDRSVESLEVKAPVGRETGQIRTGGPAT